MWVRYPKLVTKLTDFVHLELDSQFGLINMYTIYEVISLSLKRVIVLRDTHTHGQSGYISPGSG